MRCERTVLLLTLLCLVFGFQRAESQTRGPVWFEGARVITGDGSAPVENAVFVVENGRFTRIGRRGELTPPAGATRIDLTGKTVIPGLIDAHAHLGTANYRDWTISEKNFTRENLLDQLNRAAYFGLTAIYSAGSDVGDLWYTLRDEIEAGKHATAARWISAGPGLISAAQASARPGVYAIKTPEDARKAVRELAAHGVKVPKAWIDARPGRGGQQPLTPQEYEAFIDEAHKHGMRPFIHAHELEVGKRLVRAGLDGFAHKVDWPGPDEELLAMMKARGSKIFMTLTQPSPPGAEAARLANPDPMLRQTIAPMFLKKLQDGVIPKKLTSAEREEAEKTWDETYWLRPTWAAGSAEYEEARKAFDSVKAMTRRFLATGIRIGAGSDSGTFLPDRLVGWGLHVEMQEMVENGMTPAQVLVAATKTNAEWLGLDDLGTIQPGKTATFVVLDADPLVDIRNARKINAVYFKGAALDRKRMAASWTSPTTASR